MKFREGANVVSADGTKLGEVERLVVDPGQQQVTHLVITKGLFFPEERVVPLETVAQADDDTVELSSSIELEDLPLFEETHYLRIDPETAERHFPHARTAPLVWGYPFSNMAIPHGLAYPTYPEYGRGTKVVERHVPEGSHAVRAGATVVAADGEDIGKVREAQVADDGSLLAVQVDPGWFRDEQTIPVHFVKSVDEDRVELAVGSGTLSQLQD